MVALSHQAKKCPDEPGETGMMESAVLGWVSQGLQHEVIAMASWCKKGGGQKGNNCHRQTCTGTTGITVLRRDSGVVAGADLRHCLPLVNQFFRSSPERHGKLPTLNQRISLRIHHNGKSTEALETHLTNTVLLPVVCRASTGSHLFLKPLRYRLGCVVSSGCHSG